MKNRPALVDFGHWATLSFYYNALLLNNHSDLYTFKSVLKVILVRCISYYTFERNS